MSVDAKSVEATDTLAGLVAHLPPRPGSRVLFKVKGMAQKVPTSETVFASVYHCAIPELCKGMCHRYGAWHESPRPQIHRFQPQAPVPLLSRCLECAFSAPPAAPLTALASTLHTVPYIWRIARG